MIEKKREERVSRISEKRRIDHEEGDVSLMVPDSKDASDIYGCLIQDDLIIIVRRCSPPIIQWETRK